MHENQYPSMAPDATGILHPSICTNGASYALFCRNWSVQTSLTTSLLRYRGLRPPEDKFTLSDLHYHASQLNRGISCKLLSTLANGILSLLVA